MASFKYKVKDKTGKTVEGVTTGEDERSVVVQLQKMGHFVLEVRETRATDERPRRSRSPGEPFRRYVINPLFAGATVWQLAMYYRQLATMIKSGMTLVQAMSSLSTQGANPRLRKVSAETREFLEGGGRLSDSFARYPWMFSELQVSLLRAGESGGTLDKMLERIADYLDREHAVRQRLRLATLYPKILVLAVIFIPALPLLILQGFKPYLLATLGVLVPVLLGLAILWAAYRLLYQIPSVRYALDCVKLAIPKLGTTIRMLALSKFYRVLAAMTAAGAPVSQAFTHAANATGNWFLATRLKTAVPKVEQGKGYAEALEQTKVLPRMAVDMLTTGEQTGSVDEMLDKAAEYTENEAEVTTMQTTVIVGVLLLLLVAGYIGWTVVRFYLVEYMSKFNEYM